MKYTLAFIVFFLLSGLNAQDVILIEQDSVSRELCDLSWPNDFYEIQLEVYYENLTNDSIFVNWRREVDSDCPAEWSTAIVDSNLSYPPFLSESPNPITMAPLASEFFMILRFYPDEIAGACDAKIIFSLEGAEFNPIDTAYYRVAVNAEECIGTSTTEIGKEQIFLYPNPSSSTLYIESESILATMTIIDLKGIIYLEESNMVSSEVDISQLPSGLYICTFVNQEGVVHNAKFYKE